MKRWYIIHAYSGYEKQVMRSLNDRIQRSAVADSFGEVLVPTEEVVEMKDGKKRKSERKFFPGYVLVEMEMNDDTWHIVKECPKVLGFIGGTAEKPAPITQKEADAILARVRNTGEAPRPKTMFEPGEELLVIDGPFTDFKGVVEEVLYDKSRLTLTLTYLTDQLRLNWNFAKSKKQFNLFGLKTPDLRANQALLL
jgi:transcription termination/antitermination factor NusG